MTEFGTFAILIYVVGVYAQNTHKIENGIILPFIISTVSYWWAKTRFIATPIKRGNYPPCQKGDIRRIPLGHLLLFQILYSYPDHYI